MMPQGAFKKFSEMSDAEQKIILEQALQIGVLAAALAETKDRIATSNQKLTIYKELLSKQEHLYGELQRDLAAYQHERSISTRKKVKEMSLIAREILIEIELIFFIHHFRLFILFSRRFIYCHGFLCII